MAFGAVQAERVAERRAESALCGRYVLYWMQQSQRATANHALEYAILRANALGLPVLVAFGLLPDYPGANARHYQFMLEGLREVAQALRERGIVFLPRLGSPVGVVLDLADEAALIVCDRGYMPIQREWREHVVQGAGCSVVEVESDVVVPVEAVSDHVEYAARTLRPKIWRLFDRFAIDVPQVPVQHASAHWTLPRLDLTDAARVVAELGVDRSVPPVRRFRGGHTEAHRRLDAFLATGLGAYAADAPDVTGAAASQLSPYLHFGQISPLEIALRVRAEADRLPAGVDAFLEQLVVRRELAMNYAQFMPDLGTYGCLPEWARKTLADHADDPRDPVYTPEQMEQSATADPYWNAAMTEMRETGYLHNHLRMYWAKQILLWSATPREAFATVSRLNDRYFLDGRDPNSVASIAWVFGQHDRPWPERAVFGKVRSMTRSGLERKVDTQAFLQHVARVAPDENH
jgi:deoxyribodipyrimidine photo-lyase